MEELNLGVLALQKLSAEMVEDVVKLHQPELDLPVGFLASVLRVRLSDEPVRMNADTIVRLVNALEVTADELLQPTAQKHSLHRKPSLRVLRRLEKIEKLPLHQQSTLLKTIDTFLRGATGTR